MARRLFNRIEPTKVIEEPIDVTPLRLILHNFDATYKQLFQYYMQKYNPKMAQERTDRAMKFRLQKDLRIFCLVNVKGVGNITEWKENKFIALLDKL